MSSLLSPVQSLDLFRGQPSMPGKGETVSKESENKILLDALAEIERGSCRCDTTSNLVIGHALSCHRVIAQKVRIAWAKKLVKPDGEKLEFKP